MTTDINAFVRRFEVAVIAEEIRTYTGANRYPYATPITDRDVEIFLGIECNGTETIDEIIQKWKGPSRYTGNDYWEAYDRYVDGHPEVPNA